MATPVGGIGIDVELGTAQYRAEMSKLQRQIRSDTAKMRASLRQVEKANRNLARSFSNIRAGLGALAGALAVRQFGKFTKTAIDTTDALAKQSKQLRFSAKELQRYRIEGDLAGVATAKLDTGIGAFVKRVGELRAGTGTLITILDKSNVALKNQLIAASSTEEAMAIMLKTLRETGNAFDRQALSAAAFGRQAGQSIALLADSAGQLNTEMVELVTRSDDVLAAGERLQDQLTLLRSAFSAGFDSAVIEAFADSFDSSIDAMTRARIAGEGFGKAVGQTMKALATIAETVARNMREIAAAIAGLIAFKTAFVFLKIASAFGLLGAALKAAAGAQLALNLAMLVSPIGIIAAAIGAAVAAYILLKNVMGETGDAQEKYEKALEDGNKLQKDANELSGAAATAKRMEAVATLELALAKAEEVKQLEAVQLANQQGALRGLQSDRGAGATGDPALAAEARALGLATNAPGIEQNIAALKLAARARAEETAEIRAKIKALQAETPIVNINTDTTNDAAASSKAAADGYRAFKEQLTANRDAARNLAAAHKEGTEAVKKAEIGNRIRNFELKQGTELTTDQIVELHDLIAAEQEYQDTIATTIKKERERDAETERNAAESKQRTEAARQQAEDLRRQQGEEAQRLALEPFKNAIAGIQNSFTSAFESIFSGGVDTFSDLASTVKRIFIRLAAEIATLLVFRPVISSVVGAVLPGIAGSLLGGGDGIGGNLLSGGGFNLPGVSLLNNFFSTGGALDAFGASTGLFTNPVVAQGAMLSGAVPGGSAGLFSASLSGTLGAAGLGALGGGLIAQLTGGNPVGGSIGGALGAGLGAALFPALGPLAPILGGIGGSLLGSLFGGGGESVGPNAGVQIGFAGPGNPMLGVGAFGSDNGGDPSGVLAAANQMVETLNNLAKQFDFQFDLTQNNFNERSALTTDASGFSSPQAFIDALFAAGGVVSTNARVQERLSASSSFENFIERSNTAQQVQQQAVAASGGIVDFLRAQQLSPTSTLSPGERFQEAQRQFQEALESVRGGDIGATGPLVQAAQTLLGFGREQFASTVRFANLESFVRSSLLGVSEELLTDDFLARAEDKAVEAIDNQTAVLEDAIEKLRREIELLRRETKAAA
jgi:hypothetical protein